MGRAAREVRYDETMYGRLQQVGLRPLQLYDWVELGHSQWRSAIPKLIVEQWCGVGDERQRFNGQGGWFYQWVRHSTW